MGMQVLQKTQTIVRYQKHNGKVLYGIVEDDEILQLSSSFTEIVNNKLIFDGVRLKFNDVKILEPVSPSKVVNFGWTYAEHAKETGGKANLKEPFLFLKPTTSLIPNEEEIILPSSDLTKQVEMEGEVALVIGKRGKNIKENEALDYVFGCTIFNDVTA
ncbi:fumarylacetoacetate hydrolase family protein, partial [Neobacillus cucumis]|uniref:fumarylacetoacetate hydrolase family protein n=1 Tax=Neobacillus cucumis TaxID=1740721 RepID=UPI002E1B7BA6